MRRLRKERGAVGTVEPGQPVRPGLRARLRFGPLVGRSSRVARPCGKVVLIRKGKVTGGWIDRAPLPECPNPPMKVYSSNNTSQAKVRPSAPSACPEGRFLGPFATHLVQHAARARSSPGVAKSIAWGPCNGIPLRQATAETPPMLGIGVSVPFVIFSAGNDHPSQ